MSTVSEDAAWPDLDVSGWAGTKRSLHLYAQMMGKVKLALAPVQPNWLFTALYLSPRGLTTATVPYRGSSFEISLDVFDSAIRLVRSNGATAAVPLVPARTVADVYADLTAALAALQIDCTISTKPQEISDTTPLNEDRRPGEYDAIAVMRWFRASTRVAGIFDAWRARFFGRTGLQFWWGAFDIALLLFGGRHVAPPVDRGYLMRYDLDAELMNVGLYYGDASTQPFFYGYIYPEPHGAASLPMVPEQASWSSGLGEWVLPYEAVRTSPDPAATLRTFIDAVYEQCFAAAGWSRDAHTYEAPPVALEGPDARGRAHA